MFKLLLVDKKIIIFEFLGMPVSDSFLRRLGTTKATHTLVARRSNDIGRCGIRRGMSHILKRLSATLTAEAGPLKKNL